MSKTIQAARKPGPAVSLVKPAAATEVPGSHRCPLADICKGRTTLLKVPKGKTIFVPDQLAEHVYLVHHGVIGGFKVWENGDETLQTVLMTGQICGAEAIVLRDQGKIPLRDYYARTYTPTTMCRMTMTEFERTIQTDPVLGLRLVKLLAERLHDFKQLMGFSSRGSGEKRLVALLLLMGKRIGAPSADGIVITEKFSHQALAELTGCNRPTVTRNLLSLQARRLIKVERKQVHLLDPDGLEQILR